MKIYGHKDTNYGCTDTYFWHTPTRESLLAVAPADARRWSIAGKHSYHPHPKKALGYLKHGHRPYTEEQQGQRGRHGQEVPVALPPPGQPWALPREPHAAATARRRNGGSSRGFFWGGWGGDFGASSGRGEERGAAGRAGCRSAQPGAAGERRGLQRAPLALEFGNKRRKKSGSRGRAGAAQKTLPGAACPEPRLPLQPADLRYETYRSQWRGFWCNAWAHGLHYGKNDLIIARQRACRCDKWLRTRGEPGASPRAPRSGPRPGSRHPSGVSCSRGGGVSIPVPRSPAPRHLAAAPPEQRVRAGGYWSHPSLPGAFAAPLLEAVAR